MKKDNKEISTAIEAKNLYFSYAGENSKTPILRNFGIKINRGELVAIQGPSGSGKSTLLYLLGLLSQPNSGSIKILGTDTSQFTDDELARLRNQSVGFVFQQFHLLPKTTVLENILLPTRYDDEKSDNPLDLTKKATEYAQLVGLGKRLQHYPNQLSGGQQQRVAICRALINDPEIILADEPTGNLDSTAATQIMELLLKLNREFHKTIVIITHDNDIAKQCDRIVRIKDGSLVGQSADEHPLNSKSLQKLSPQNKSLSHWSDKLRQIWDLTREAVPSAFWNLKRHKTRTALTMIGISVGVAAVLAMVTLGQFTKRNIMNGYAEMGANTLIFNGIPNWELKATDLVPLPFRFFDWELEFRFLTKIFPEIIRMSPLLSSDRASINCGGRTIDQEAKVQGINEDGLIILKRHLLFGRNFSHVEMEQRSPVCTIGFDIAERLFFDSEPLGQVLRISEGTSSYSCRVVGVLARASTNKEFLKPNLQVFVPYTFFQAQGGNWWSSQLKQVIIQLSDNANVEKTGRGIRTFFEQKYGPSGKFSVDSDSVLVAQMKQFLTLFTLLLSSVAFVTLAVGGIGITNMMLVSISERFREIGLKKALGATNREIRVQFLVESMIVCLLAGVMGLIIGFVTYNAAIWTATRFLGKLGFTWTFDGMALLLSILSIFLVGLFSGIFPALKAEKLQVIEALRAD